MNTHVCFILLLAIGLSVQKTEFEIDFDNMVETVKLKDNTTLLNCPKNCTEEKILLFIQKPECKCRKFPCSEGTPVIDCIEKGLDDLKLNQTENIIARLKDLNIPSGNPYHSNTDISPKAFLDIIVKLYQQANANKSV